MQLLEKITSVFKENKIIKDLWHFDKEPLSIFSILLLIALDIFLLTAVYNGISAEQAKNPYPTAYFPQQCTLHFDESHKVPSNTKYDDFYNDYTDYEPLYKSKICGELDDKIKTITNNQYFKTNQKTYFNLRDQKYHINTQITSLRNSYDTRLIEKIANETNDEELTKAKNQFDTLTKELNDIETQLQNLPAVSTYEGFEELRGFVDAKRQTFISQKESYERWYPFYQYFRMLSFVLPLFLIVWLLYRSFGNSKAKGVINIICANLIAILSVPIFIGTVGLIYDLIPKLLLTKIVDFLISIGFLSILKYLIITLITTIIGVLIYWIQKNAKSKREFLDRSQITKTIANGQCGECKNKVDLGFGFCPSCGNSLRVVCPHCKKETTKGLPCCFNCGGVLDTQKSEDA